MPGAETVWARPVDGGDFQNTARATTDSSSKVGDGRDSSEGLSQVSLSYFGGSALILIAGLFGISRPVLRREGGGEPRPIGMFMRRHSLYPESGTELPLLNVIDGREFWRRHSGSCQMGAVNGIRCRASCLTIRATVRAADERLEVAGV